ncbi:hypothetical protein EW026_g3043 [Hermanssonia centrifuga]|uniref:DUF6535 domain-containing protein n=1 Tax=Hermanssonia centrifuga TaxID=98765 RepID=A0A4S4KLD5_9APHY|nr:hypothetical protein EW026_g3043 [Hermanssonia centrifuga]
MDDKQAYEGNIRYVVSQRPEGGYVISEMSSGWSEMAQTVKEVDDGKIRDCKEDIDTLLVFAGLFSAIMTAFLIESYQLLLPSDTTTTIDLLKQISSQTHSYTISNSSLNSTVLPLSDSTEPFEPPLSAIRINVLWFASLIFSLVSASFGILVKQWLREYLAVDNTSPLARLRVRQFRYPGLADWKVFEIAAVLPLLLQLSLGLFLLGLCIFTWSIHPTVGKTSTPIIAGWAFLFAAVTFAPVFSARCPYKTTLLKAPLKSLRVLLRKTRPFLSRTSWKMMNRKQCPPEKHGEPKSEPQHAQEDGKHILPLEEDVAVTDEMNDPEILAAVDTILLDDDLLRTTMWESLQQTILTPSGVMIFVFKAINNRLQQDIVSPFTSILDLRQLTKRGWGAIIDITAGTLNRNFDSGTPLPNWMEEALVILISLSDFPLTLNGNRALSRWMSPETREHASRIIASHTPSFESLTHVLRRLRIAFKLFPPQDPPVCIGLIMRDRIVDGNQSTTFAELMRTHPEVSEETVDAILSILLDVFTREFSNPAGFQWTQYGTSLALYTILSIPAPSSARRDVSLLLSTLLKRGDLLYRFMTHLGPLDPTYRAFEPGASSNFAFAYIDSDIAGRRTILDNQTNVLGNCNQGIGFWSLSPVYLCRVYVKMLDTTRKNDAFNAELRPSWEDLWTKTAIAIRRLKSRDDDAEEHRKLAEECLHCLTDLDGGIPLNFQDGDIIGHDTDAEPKVDYTTWLEAFKPNDSIFPDDLFDSLSMFVPVDFALTFNRVRRIRGVRTCKQAFSSGIRGTALLDNSIQPQRVGFGAQTFGSGRELLSFEKDVTLDYDFLHTTIWKASHQSPPALSDVIKFVLEVIQRRLPENTPLSLRTSILDLRQVTETAVWNSIVDMVADLLICNSPFQPSPQGWMEDALVILISTSDYPLTLSGNRALSLWMSEEVRERASHIIASHTPDWESFTHVIRRLRAAFVPFLPQDPSACVAYIIRERIADGSRIMPYADMVRMHPEVPEDTVHVILLILVDICTRELFNPAGFPLHPQNTSLALYVILSTQVPWSARQDIAALHPELRAFEPIGSSTLAFVYIESDVPGRQTIVDHQLSHLVHYIEGSYDDLGYWPVSPVCLCRVYLRILDAAQKNDAFVARLRPQWQKLWNQTTGAITQLKTKSYDAQDHQEVAEDCFGLLQDLDSRPSLKLQGGNNAPGNEQYEDASSEEDYECTGKLRA